MPRCDKCGRDNSEDAVFCQDCGNRLADAAPAAPASPTGERSCPNCETVNPPGTVFCRQCGTGLGPAPDRSGPVVKVSGGSDCPFCGKSTPVGFAFCQHCGRQLDPGEGPPAPTPPAGIRVATDGPAPPPRAPAPAPPPAPVSRSAALASTPLGSRSPPTPVALPRPEWPQAAPGGGGVPSAVAGMISDSGPALAAAYPAAPAPGLSQSARLVTVNRDGTDGASHEIAGDRFEIGRTEGHLRFDQDGYLADRHARVERRAGRFFVVDLDTLNGVFFRLRTREPLQDRSVLLIGMQLLRFEALSNQERDPPPTVEHGVLLFGTPPRRPWGRLRQITTAGLTRDVYHLYRGEIVVGRESGDIVFSDDEFMSRAHTAIRNEGGRAFAMDMNSSNGTFLRIHGERALEDGDMIRLGDQLLRFESRARG